MLRADKPRVRGASRGRTVLAILLAVLAVALIGPAKAALPVRSCAETDAKLVPACGVWWGIWPRADAAGKVSTNLPANLSSLEQGLGRQFDIVSRYKGWGQDVYDAWDYGFRDSGHLVLQDLTARNFSTDTYVRWADIAAGKYDDYLRRQAERTKAFGARTFFSFNQEPEQALERGVAGTPAEYASAYRHVRAVFDAEHVTNAVWVWWVMGYSGHNNVYPQLWPGADVVDWIGYDPYDFGPCHGTAPKTEPADPAELVPLDRRAAVGRRQAAHAARVRQQRHRQGRLVRRDPRRAEVLAPDQGGCRVQLRQRLRPPHLGLAGQLRRLPRRLPGPVRQPSVDDPAPACGRHRDTGGPGSPAGAGTPAGTGTPPATACGSTGARLEPACGVLWGVWPRASAHRPDEPAPRRQRRIAGGSRRPEDGHLVLRYRGGASPCSTPRTPPCATAATSCSRTSPC